MIPGLPVKRLGPDGKFGWYLGDRLLTDHEMLHIREELQRVVDETASDIEAATELLWPLLGEAPLSPREAQP